MFFSYLGFDPFRTGKKKRITLMFLTPKLLQEEIRCKIDGMLREFFEQLSLQSKMLVLPASFSFSRLSCQKDPKNYCCSVVLTRHAYSGTFQAQRHTQSPSTKPNAHYTLQPRPSRALANPVCLALSTAIAKYQNKVNPNVIPATRMYAND